MDPIDNTEIFGHGCDWFKNSLVEIGEKGVAVVARSNELGRSFHLDVRPFEKDVAYAISQRDLVDEGMSFLARPISVAISTLVPILHCPGCGIRLADLIKAHPAAFEALAEDHRMRS